MKATQTALFEIHRTSTKPTASHSIYRDGRLLFSTTEDAAKRLLDAYKTLDEMLIAFDDMKENYDDESVVHCISNDAHKLLNNLNA